MISLRGKFKKKLQNSQCHMKVSFKLCDKLCSDVLFVTRSFFYYSPLLLLHTIFRQVSHHKFSRQTTFDTNLRALQCHGPRNQLPTCSNILINFFFVTKSRAMKKRTSNKCNVFRIIRQLISLEYQRKIIICS